MDVNSLVPVIGIIQEIEPRQGLCGELMLSLNTPDGPVNIILTPETYVVDNTRMRPGMRIAAYYDNTAPVPLIYPPQYRAIVITSLRNTENVTIRFFDRSLTASDQSLRLNIAPSTNISTSNGQRYACRLGDQPLMVFFDVTTRSIPPQTTPRRIIVF